jgi:hypothetical protein
MTWFWGEEILRVGGGGDLGILRETGFGECLVFIVAQDDMIDEDDMAS